MDYPRIIEIREMSANDLFCSAFELRDYVPQVITESRWPEVAEQLGLIRDTFQAARDAAGKNGDWNAFHYAREAEKTEKMMDALEPMWTETDFEHLKELTRGR